jgi:hypothetical protein
MKIKLNALILTGILVLGFTTLKAQDPPPTLKVLPGTYSAGQLKAAERMFYASGVIENMQKTFATVIQNQAAQVPDDKRPAFIKVMSDFFAKYMDTESIKKEFIPLYASEFTEKELNQIADFLSTPAGKAMTDKEPELMAKGMAWGQQVVQEHQQELESAMDKAMGK